MRELLHSKTFRTNLTKWLFMYIGVIVCITSVITYSRYISSLQTAGQARPAKFNIKIKNLNTDCEDNLGSTNESSCTQKIKRPERYYIYNFEVDLSDLEVAVDLLTRVSIGQSLTLTPEDGVDGDSQLGLYVSGSSEKITSSTSGYSNIEFKTIGENDVIDLSQTINLNNKQNIKYTLVARYKNCNTDIGTKTASAKDIVVGYSATQKN